MKRVIVGLLCIMLIHGSFAQTTHKHQKHHNKEHNKQWGERKNGMDDKLNLSDAQKSRMKTINENFRNKMQALQQDSNLSNEVRKQGREELISAHRTEMMSILNPEQKAKWEENRNKGAANRKDEQQGNKNMKRDGEAHANRNGEQRTGRMREELNLSADQAARIKTINQNFRNDLQNIRKNENLTQEQKKEQTRILQKQHKENISALLTSEQKEKFNSLHKNRSPKSRDKYTK